MRFIYALGLFVGNELTLILYPLVFVLTVSNHTVFFRAAQLVPSHLA